MRYDGYLLIKKFSKQILGFQYGELFFIHRVVVHEIENNGVAVIVHLLTECVGQASESNDGNNARTCYIQLKEKLGLRQRKSGGERGIRTLDRAFGPYNGLANRRLQPLGHLSAMGCWKRLEH